MSNHQTEDITAYYRETLGHYRTWGLLDARSLHYGLWDSETRSLHDSLLNMTRFLTDVVTGEPVGDVLDAGCGVGGISISIAGKAGCRVTGITLYDELAEQAKRFSIQEGTDDRTRFEVMDFTRTTFADATFDTVLACESSCHAHPKTAFLNEMNRILKPGGRLIIADYFLTGRPDPCRWIEKWGATWAISDFNSETNFVQPLTRTGFTLLRDEDLSRQILPTARRMYLAFWLSALPSVFYNFFIGARRYAAIHYRSGYYQYKALKSGLWKYRLLVARKTGG
ncbi:MAG: methyltransferase domain-containing protein [Bacteroidetes bacterium]|nr:methyltransferase domain-containing protein [Bacteroidota bacterium]